MTQEKLFDTIDKQDESLRKCAIRVKLASDKFNESLANYLIFMETFDAVRKEMVKEQKIMQKLIEKINPEN